MRRDKTINRITAYHNSRHIEDFREQTGLTRAQARAWMRNTRLPVLHDRWFVERPKKGIVGRAVSIMQETISKYPDKPVTYKGISDCLDLFNKGGMA